MAAKRGARRDGSAYDALNDQQQKFVDEYLVDLNATQAAIRAGYSEKTAAEMGYENLRKPHIATALQERRIELAENTGITPERVITELAKLGFSDIRKAIRWGTLEAIEHPVSGEAVIPNGVFLVDSSEIDDDTAAAIQEISQGANGIKLKMYDKKGALVDIGRHLGMFDDKLRLLGDDKNPIHTVTRIELVAARRDNSED